MIPVVRLLVELLLAATFARMLIYQLYVKVSKLSRTGRTLRDASGRFPKACAFLFSMWQYDLEVIRRSRRCIDHLTSASVAEVTLFGVGDVARVLYYLTFAAPIKIVAVYDDIAFDDIPQERFLRWRVQPAAVCRAQDHQVIVAALVGVEDKVQKLRESGVRSDRIIEIP